MDPLINLTIALAMATLCGGSAVHHLAGWAEWPEIVRNYRLMPTSMTRVVAAAIPVLESMAAAALLWPRTRHLGALAAAVLLSMFALALWINIRRGRSHIDCGCFGVRLRTGLSRGMAWRNLALAALALSLLTPVTARTVSPPDVVAALISVATLALLYPVLNLLLEPRRDWQRDHDRATLREVR